MYCTTQKHLGHIYSSDINDDCISKFFTSVLNNKLRTFIESYNVFNEEQAGLSPVTQPLITLLY